MILNIHGKITLWRSCVLCTVCEFLYILYYLGLITKNFVIGVARVMEREVATLQFPQSQLSHKHARAQRLERVHPPCCSHPLFNYILHFTSAPLGLHKMTKLHSMCHSVIHSTSSCKIHLLALVPGLPRCTFLIVCGQKTLTTWNGEGPGPRLYIFYESNTYMGRHRTTVYLNSPS